MGGGSAGILERLSRLIDCRGPFAPRPLDRGIAVLLTGVFAAATAVWPAFPRALPFLRWDMWVWFVTCGATLLAAARFRMRHSVPAPDLCLAAFPFAFQFFFQMVIPTTRVASVDALLWRFDASFGYPQIGLSNLLLSSPAIFWGCKLTWWSLPTLFALLYLALPERERRKYAATIACTGVLILPLYALCPAAGPGYLFGARYPNAVPLAPADPQPVHLAAGLLLNTTPSGHVAWALLLCGFARRYCRRGVALAFGAAGIVTATATLGLGEHYVIDLALSAPYAGAIVALVGREWRRGAALLALVVVWLVVLREGWGLGWSAPTVWVLSAATILAPAVGRRRRTEERPAEQPCASAAAVCFNETATP